MPLLFLLSGNEYLPEERGVGSRDLVSVCYLQCLWNIEIIGKSKLEAFLELNFNFYIEFSMLKNMYEPVDGRS